MDSDPMKKLLLLFVLLFIPSIASAQCNGVFPANTICGTIPGGIPAPVSTSVLTGIPGGINGQVQYNNAGTFGGLTNTQLTALINQFSSSLSGAVPASGGSSTALFLNQAGTFTSPISSLYNIVTYGAVPDYHEASTLSTGGGATITATGSPFTSGMVGDIISVDGMGVAGAPYFGTISGFTNANSITVTPGTSTAQANVYGQWCIDNTSAVQLAINAARSAGGGTIIVPAAATYCIQQLDFTNGPPMTLKGASTVNASRFMPMRNTNSVMDWTGTSSPNIDGISVGQYNQIASPSYGLVLSPSNPASGIDFVNLRNVFWTGRYQGATWYNDRTASSHCQKSSFLNYYLGAPNTGFTAIFTNNNIFGFSSNYATTFVGAESLSDWSFIGCEFHSIDQGGGVAPYAALYLDNTANLSFFGGNMATSHASIIQVAPGTATNTLFQGVTFYNDTGPAPVNVFTGAGNLNRTGMYFNGIAYSGAAINIGGANTASIIAP